MSGAATRARSDQDDTYFIDLRKLDEIYTTLDFDSYGNEEVCLAILQGSLLHGVVRDDFSSFSDEAAIGPFQFFRLLTENDINECKPYDLAKKDVEQFILNRMESSEQNTFLAKLKLLFSDRFQTNYLDALIYPLCKQTRVAFVHSYILKSSIITAPINGRVHGRARLTEMARYNSIFCGTYNDGMHFIAYMVVMPWEEGQSDGYILIFNPMHQPPDPECLKDVSNLAKFIAHVKLNRFPEDARLMPRMHVVHVHHPKEFTQNHPDYPPDSCCNFWSAILLKIWLNFYLGSCRQSVKTFLSYLKTLFPPGTSGTYDFYTVNHRFTVARTPDYTMASIRVLTALYLQQFYQHDDLKMAIKGLKIEAEIQELGGAENLTYEKTEQILNDYWSPMSGMSYVMAGHAKAYERYMTLVASFRSKSHDERTIMLKNTPQLDMFRIIYSIFDKRTESSRGSHNELCEDFMKRILIFNFKVKGKKVFPQAIVQLKPGWRKTPYECSKKLAFDPQDVKLVSRDDRGKPGSRAGKRRSVDLSKSDDEVTEAMNEGEEIEEEGATESGLVTHVDADDDE